MSLPLGERSKISGRMQSGTVTPAVHRVSDDRKVPARVEIADLASMIGRAAGVSLRVYPIPDVLLRNIGRVVDVVGPYLPFDAPMTAAAMQYYTQMPSCDDSPSENELGITYRDPQETLADTVSGLRRLGRV